MKKISCKTALKVLSMPFFRKIKLQENAVKLTTMKYTHVSTACADNKFVACLVCDSVLLLHTENMWRKN